MRRGNARFSRPAVPAWCLFGEFASPVERAGGSALDRRGADTGLPKLVCLLPAIVEICEPEATGTTDADGEITFYLPPGDYIVIGDDGTDKHLGVSASDCFQGVEMNKFLQQIIRADNQKLPAKTNRHQQEDGSELRIIEPEYIVWDDTEQAYPFIFETADEFGVAVAVAPPEGFVADHDSLSAEVINETESVQFTVTEVGSDLVPTETTFQIVRHGRLQTVRSKVGIKLTANYARQRGFNVRALRAQGTIFDPPGQRANPPGRRGNGRDNRP